MKLSILILSIPERQNLLQGLLKFLNDQIDKEPKRKIEILVLLDNKKRSISQKRNDLLSIAKGDYICFLDDDDMVSPIYIEKVYAFLDRNVDCITFNQRCSIDGRSLSVSFGLGNPHEGLVLNNSGNYNNIKRPPYHMCVFRRTLAQTVKFRDTYSTTGQSIEDIDWLKRLYPKLETEIHIPEYLHIYRYNSNSTASIK